MSDNSFGTLFRVTTWGESHGPAIGCVVDGCPPGIEIDADDLQVWLDKRRPQGIKIMATWANLTQEQRDVYLTFENELRGAMGQFQRLLNKFERLDVTYNAQISAILVDLDNNTIVPKSSGLDGAASLDSDAEMVAMVAHWQSALTTFNTTGHKNLRDKAAGTINTAGENR